jgi:hypothetical protein
LNALVSNNYTKELNRGLIELRFARVNVEAALLKLLEDLLYVLIVLL